MFIPYHFICLDYCHILYIVLYCLIHCLNLMNFRLWYEGTWKYLGESVTGSKNGMQNWRDGSCIAVRDGRAGMPTDAQVGQHSSTAHVQGFPALRGKQTIMPSLDDVSTMVLMLRVGSYIRRVCMSLGTLIWVFSCSTFDSNWLGTTDPFLQLLWCPLRSGL